MTFSSEAVHCDESNASISDLFENKVSCYQDKLAVQIDSQSLTYGELDRAANDIAYRIYSEGNFRVGVLLEKSVSVIVSIMGIFKAAQTYVPMDPFSPEERLTFIKQNADIKFIITNNQYFLLAKKLMGGDKGILNIEDPQLPVSLSYRKRQIPYESINCILYTSGTTGEPKGVIHTQKTLLHNSIHYTKTLDVNEDDRIVCPSSLSFSGGIKALLGALLNGAAIFHLKKEELVSISELLISEQITIYHSVASVFRYVVNTLSADKDLSSLRAFYITGEPLYRSDLKKHPYLFGKNRIFVNVLGMSETGVISEFFINHIRDHKGEVIPVGCNVEKNIDKEIFLLDESGKKIKKGEAGEIAVKSSFLSPGYWGNPQLTAKKFLQDPRNKKKRIYLTGDIGRILPNGYFLYRGRKDFMVKIRGFLVETEEIDSALSSLESVKEAVVVARNDAHSNEKRLLAYIVSSTAMPPSVNELREYLAKKLPDYMIPSGFVMIDKLPLTANGKIDRKSLPAFDFQRPDLANGFVTPSSQLEKSLERIWKDVLKIDKIGLHDNFFDLGGNSLLGVKLVAEITKVTGISLPPRALYKFTTIDEMVKIIEPSDSSTHKKASKDNNFSSGKLSEQDYTRMLAVLAGGNLEKVNDSSLMHQINVDSSKPPLFWCFNRVTKIVQECGKYLGKEQPVYGMFSGGRAIPKRTEQIIDAIASHYVQEILSVQPKGPYFIGGNCAGAKVAMKIAFELMALGKTIERLCLLEFFDAKLYDFPNKVLLLYGRESNRKFYEFFGWDVPGWEEAFRVVPLVDWVPGGHGEFFSHSNIRILLKKVALYLESDLSRYRSAAYQDGEEWAVYRYRIKQKKRKKRNKKSKNLNFGNMISAVVWKTRRFVRQLLKKMYPVTGLSRKSKSDP